VQAVDERRAIFSSCQNKYIHFASVQLNKSPIGTRRPPLLLIKMTFITLLV
jgi:hypothetical protein